MTDIIKRLRLFADGKYSVADDAADELERMTRDNAALEAHILELREAIGWIERVNAMDYEYRKVAKEALATKPSTEYLKAWLGEPRSHLYKYVDCFGYEVLSASLPPDSRKITDTVPLYAPKGLEK